MVDSKKRFSVTLTGQYEVAMDRLVKEGLYINHQDLIRHALRSLFRFHWVKPFCEDARIDREKELNELRAKANGNF